MITAICLIIVLLFISSGIHSMSRQYNKDREALITKGKHAGRKGKVVSCWPFDLVVCINTSPSFEEQEKIIQDRLKRNSGWKLPHEAKHPGEDVAEHAKNARVWLHTWRWKTRIDTVNS